MTAAAEISLSEDLEAEFNPHVLIVANDLDRYQKFADLLIKNGFEAKVTHEASPDIVRPGTVFFFSINFQGTEPTAAVKYLELQLGLACIVFAESEDFRTAAKLSSAKMTQTLQYPYTEKNFLMAVQTIVKKRKEQHQKNLRKQNHKDRQKTNAETNSKAEAAKTRLFKTNSSEMKNGIIVQKGPRSLSDRGIEVFKGEATKTHSIHTSQASLENLMTMQKSSKGKGFFAILHNDSKHPDSKMVKGNAMTKAVVVQGTVNGEALDSTVSASTAAAKVRSTVAAKAEQILNLVRPTPAAKKEKTEGAAALSSAAVNSAAPATSLPQPSSAVAVAAASDEKPSSEPVSTRGRQPYLPFESSYSPMTFWAVLLTSIIGILICLYCVYEILYGNRY